MSIPRVLHIVDNLHRGSVERWLLRLWRHARSKGAPLDWTFYCTLPDVGELEEEAASEGLGIIHSPVPLDDKTAFLRALRRAAREGDYDVIHSHHDLLSAFYWSGLVGVPGARVTHVHNTDEILPTSSRWKRALFREPMRQFAIRGSDCVLATSSHALDQFLDGKKRRTSDTVHYCSLDVRDYIRSEPDRETVRNELGLSPETEILLFAGTLIDIKNPVFVVDVLKRLLAVRPGAVAVFVGDGPEAGRVAAAAVREGVRERIRLLGWREDLPRLMRAADLFINPRRESPREGFGLVVLEAQAAGLRVLISDGISTEPILEGSVWRQLPLRAGAQAWADAAAGLLETPRSSDGNVRETFGRSPFDPDRAGNQLATIYRGLQPA